VYYTPKIDFPCDSFFDVSIDIPYDWASESFFDIAYEFPIPDIPPESFFDVYFEPPVDSGPGTSARSDVFTPVPLLRLDSSSPSQEVAYCSIMPYLEVTQPTGPVVSLSEGNSLDVTALLPLTSTETLQIKVDGVEILETLEPHFGFAYTSVCAQPYWLAGRDAGSFSLSSPAYWLAGRDAGSFSLSSPAYWLAGRDAGSFSLGADRPGVDRLVDLGANLPFDNLLPTPPAPIGVAGTLMHELGHNIYTRFGVSELGPLSVFLLTSAGIASGGARFFPGRPIQAATKFDVGGEYGEFHTSCSKCLDDNLGGGEYGILSGSLPSRLGSLVETVDNYGRVISGHLLQLSSMASQLQDLRTQLQAARLRNARLRARNIQPRFTFSHGGHVFMANMHLDSSSRIQLFQSDGIPLRSKVTLILSQQDLGDIRQFTMFSNIMKTMHDSPRAVIGGSR